MTLKRFRTASIHEIYDGAREPRIDLYVYSTTDNPNGAGEGTYAHYIGTADSYAMAELLWDAAVGTARAIGGYNAALEIGLCVDTDALLKDAAKHMIWAKSQKGKVGDGLYTVWLEDAVEGIRYALGETA